jgi:hypothetical protein
VRSALLLLLLLLLLVRESLLVQRLSLSPLCSGSPVNGASELVR